MIALGPYRGRMLDDVHLESPSGIVEVDIVEHPAAVRAKSNHSAPPYERITSAALLQSSTVALENSFHRPCVPPTAQPSGVMPCLLRWLGSEPAASRIATTSGRPKNAAHPRAMAWFSASRSDTLAPYS